MQEPREPDSTRQMNQRRGVEKGCPEASAMAAPASRVHVYDLRPGERTSDGFYAVVSRVTDEALVRVERRAGAILDGYERHVHFLAESPRSRGEYAIELLTLGMALRRYEGAAEKTASWIVGLARRLTWARTRSERAKPLVDWMRAGIASLVFAPRAGYSARKTGSAVERLARLVGWLEATGEFGQESKRLRNWRSYLRQMSPEKATHWLQVAEELFAEFERDAAKVLGAYTQNVAAFVEREQSQRRWREDTLLRSRTAAEYHLNMVAAEVMNRGLRTEFERTRQKVVLVPTCMRGRRSSDCRARVDGVDMTCTGCDPDCAVNRITRRMRAEGVAVYLVPHASGFSRWLRRWEKTDCGVAAVACMLNILPGGYEMRERHIASQCVPLDFPGCRRHWDKEGFPTAVNEERLVQITAGTQY
jgi:uncharacterized protein